MKKPVFFLLLAILSFFAFLLILLSTSRLGVNLGGDSVCYILLAQGFLDHSVNPEIMKELLLIWGPLFPFVLSLGGHIGIDLFQGARWANALFFGCSIFLAGSILKKYIDSSWLSLCGALLILAASDMVEIHLKAMSEPLFIVFFLLWLLFFWEYLKKPRSSILIAASICAALSLLTRYMGIALVASGLFGVFFLSQQPAVRKIRHAVTFIVISCVPLGSFLAWYKFFFGKVSARSFSFHPLTSHDWQGVTSVFCDWFVSRRIYAQDSPWLLLIGMMGLFLAGFILWDRLRKASGEDRHIPVSLKFSVFLIAFILIYTTLVILAVSFFDAKVIFGFKRYFLFVHIAGLFLLFEFMKFRNDIGKIILIYLFMFYSVNAASYLIKQYTLGDRYTTGPLRASLIIRTIKEMPLKIPIYTNDGFLVYVLAHREFSEIPSLRDAMNRKKNDEYASQFARMEGDLKNKRGVLVYFNEDYTESGAEPIGQISRKIPLHLIARDPYGAIYVRGAGILFRKN